MALQKSPKLLVVDDDAMLLRSLARLLGEFYDVTTVSSGAAALAALAAEHFDLITSDWNMPGGMDGADLLETFYEKHPDIPVLVITGVDRPEQAVLAVPFACGYLRKPVDIEQFHMAAQRCLTRRTSGSDAAHETKGAITFAPMRCAVAIEGGEWIRLSSTELRMFAVLWEHAGQAISQKEIAAAIHGRQVEDPAEASRACRRVTHALRTKLEPDSKRPRFIVTAWGEGVRLMVTTDASGE